MDERFANFGCLYDEYQTEYMTDITCDVECKNYGFIKHGSIDGFFFSERYIYLPYQDKPEKFYVTGIQDGEFEDWFLLKLKNCCTTIQLIGDSHPDILLLTNEDKIIFFGMQKDGKPNGLGVAVNYNNDNTKSLSLGYYTDGTLTHIFTEEKLLPI